MLLLHVNWQIMCMAGTAICSRNLISGMLTCLTRSMLHRYIHSLTHAADTNLVSDAVLTVHTSLSQESAQPIRRNFDRWMAAVEDADRAEQRADRAEQHAAAAKREVAAMRATLQAAWEEAERQLQAEQRARAGWAALATDERAARMAADYAAARAQETADGYQATLAACQVALACESATKDALAAELAAERAAHAGTQAALQAQARTRCASMLGF